MGIQKGSITRRDFLISTTLSTVGLTFGADKIWSIISPQGSGSERSKVIIGKSEKILDEKNNVNQKIVDILLDKMMKKYTIKKDAGSSWKELFSPKDVVAIKTNVQVTKTHNELILSIVKSLKSIGIPDDKIIIFERGRGGYGEKGIYQMDISFGFSKNSISKIITDNATALINVPGTKSHWLSGVGVCLKNWCGAVTNINVKDENVTFVIHKNSCEDLGLISVSPDIKNKLRLNIADALIPLAHGGPQVDPKYLWQNKELILSTDQVAVDAVCLKLIQDKRKELKGDDWPLYPPPIHIAAAQNKYKLGIADLNRIDIERVVV
jgi:hypothetical protein